VYIEHDLLWHINNSLTSGWVPRWWRTKKWRKIAVWLRYWLKAQTDRPTDPPTEWHLPFPLKHPQLGHNGEPCHCQMHFKHVQFPQVFGQVLPFDFLLDGKLFLNITFSVFFLCHSCSTVRSVSDRCGHHFSCPVPTYIQIHMWLSGLWLGLKVCLLFVPSQREIYCFASSLSQSWIASGALVLGASSRVLPEGVGCHFWHLRCHTMATRWPLSGHSIVSL